jgi:small subunit ribosomal protein S8
VTLRWDPNHKSAISGLRRVSKPGQRKYVASDGLPKVRGGLGTAFISTSKGMMTDRQARKAGVGGEVICEVW